MEPRPVHGTAPPHVHGRRLPAVSVVRDPVQTEPLPAKALRHRHVAVGGDGDLDGGTAGGEHPEVPRGPVAVREGDDARRVLRDQGAAIERHAGRNVGGLQGPVGVLRGARLELAADPDSEGDAAEAEPRRGRGAGGPPDGPIGRDGHLRRAGVGADGEHAARRRAAAAREDGDGGDAGRVGHGPCESNGGAVGAVWAPEGGARVLRCRGRPGGLQRQGLGRRQREPDGVQEHPTRPSPGALPRQAAVRLHVDAGWARAGCDGEDQPPLGAVRRGQDRNAGAGARGGPHGPHERDGVPLPPGARPQLEPRLDRSGAGLPPWPQRQRQLRGTTAVGVGVGVEVLRGVGQDLDLGLEVGLAGPLHLHGGGAGLCLRVLLHHHGLPTPESEGEIPGAPVQVVPPVAGPLVAAPLVQEDGARRGVAAAVVEAFVIAVRRVAAEHLDLDAAVVETGPRDADVNDHCGAEPEQVQHIVHGCRNVERPGTLRRGRGRDTQKRPVSPGV